MKKMYIAVTYDLYCGEPEELMERATENQPFTFYSGVGMALERFENEILATELDGTFDLSMAMSSAATMSLNGTALAADTANDESVYAEIVEFIEGRKWYTNLVDIVYADEDGEFYAIFKNGSTAIIEGDEPDLEVLPSKTALATPTSVTSIKVNSKVYYES